MKNQKQIQADLKKLKTYLKKANKISVWEKGWIIEVNPDALLKPNMINTEKHLLSIMQKMKESLIYCTYSNNVNPCIKYEEKALDQIKLIILNLRQNIKSL